MPDQDPIGRLILELGRLPGVGERSAARLAYYIIKTSCLRSTPATRNTANLAAPRPSPSLAQDLAAALLDVCASVVLCQTCQNLSSSAVCSLCRDSRREPRIVCVVASVADVRAIEQSGVYRGLYHVLHGVLAPLDGIGPQQLKIDALLQRLQTALIEEVILAVGTHVEGDATALYLAQRLKDMGITHITRPAAGIPLGGELEYLDQGTLGRALIDRQAF